MLVVYADSDPQMNSALSNDMRKAIEEVATLKIYEGAPPTNEEFIERVKDADAIILDWSIPTEVLNACPNLKYIAFTGIDYSNFIDTNYLEERGIKVGNTPGYADVSVAEHTVALILALAKNIVPYHLEVREAKWHQNMVNYELHGKTIGLIGMGSIGGKVVEYCKALGMNVIAWTFNPSKERAERMGIKFVELEELVKQSDFVSLHLPSTQETHQIIDEKLLNSFKEGSFLINTARAEIVDQEALVKVLDSGRIAKAAFDVFSEEPVSPNNPLINRDDVLLSPHVAFNTNEAIMKIMEITKNNILNFIMTEESE